MSHFGESETDFDLQLPEEKSIFVPPMSMDSGLLACSILIRDITKTAEFYYLMNFKLLDIITIDHPQTWKLQLPSSGGRKITDPSPSAEGAGKAWSEAATA